ncbi:MAG: UbiA family prenyltransferase [Aquificae bacterium]|nr:UbiA family prenyltransferase [Aquificota bacterium]
MRKLRALMEVIKFEHTIFALPFALAAVLLLAQRPPSAEKILLIVLAVVFARTAGMAFNRWIDYEIDRKNPRTRRWAHIRGEISLEAVKLTAVLSAAAFVVVAALINNLALLLSPIVVFLLWFYPYAKRITHAPHAVLGLVYFLIPVAVDVALNERISPLSLLLGGAMAAWVFGFDVLYSLQDYEFDRRHGVKSLAVKLGKERAIKAARLAHLITFLLLLAVGFLHPKMGPLYFVGLLLLAAFLVYEHRLVKPNDLSKLNKAFFTVNGWISVVYFLVVLVDYLV